MCLSTVYESTDPDRIIMEYVSMIVINGDKITLTDVMGDKKTVAGTLEMADLTGGVVRIRESS